LQKRKQKPTLSVPKIVDKAKEMGTRNKRLSQKGGKGVPPGGRGVLKGST